MTNKKSLDRRSLLKGLGVSPLLFSPLVQAIRAEAQTGTPKRLLLVRVAHGFGGRDMATGTETSFVLKPWLQAFNAIKSDSIFIDGLLGAFWGNAHDVSYSHLFTSSVQPGTASFSRPRSASLDVMVDNFLGSSVLPVLRLSAGGGSSAMCFDNNLTPLAFQANSTLALNSVIANISTGNASSTVNSQVFRRRAILDAAKSDIAALRARVSVSEKTKLDAHLEAINNASRLLGLNASSAPIAACSAPTVGNGSGFEAELDRQLMAIKAAFSCQLGHVAVLNVNEIPHDIYTWKDSGNASRRGRPCGNSDFHQCVAHYEGSDRRLAFEGSVDWFARKFAAFAMSLKSVTESNGKSVLDNTIIALTGEVGDGQHEVLAKPYIILGGSGSPGLSTGRYIKVPRYTDSYVRTSEGDHTLYGSRSISTRTEGDLWREVAGAMGLTLATFGSSYLNKGSIGIKG